MEDVQIIVKLAIKPTKHYQRTTHKNRRMPPPRLRHRLHQPHLTPHFLPNIEAVQIADVLFVAAAQDVQFVFEDGGGVAPAGVGHGWLS